MSSSVQAYALGPPNPNPEPAHAEPAGYRFLGNSGKRTSNPRIAIDPIGKRIEIQSKRDLEKNTEYTPLPIQRRENNFTLFADADDYTKPTTEMTAESGEGNVMIARFRLDKLPLGVYTHLLRIFGLITTVYIRNLEESRPSTLMKGGNHHV